VPGVEGGAVPLPEKLVLTVNTAGDVSEHDAVDELLSVQTDAVIVCSDSAPLAPPLAPTYMRHPTTCGLALFALVLTLATGGCIVITDVDPVVVITDEVAVSVEHGVSVLVLENNVTHTRYDPAAMLPPVATCEIPVPVPLLKLCAVLIAGGASVTTSVNDCEAGYGNCPTHNAASANHATIR
jgi:hypothetical protein